MTEDFADHYAHTQAGRIADLERQLAECRATQELPTDTDMTGRRWDSDDTATDIACLKRRIRELFLDRIAAIGQDQERGEAECWYAEYRAGVEAAHTAIRDGAQ